MTLIIPIGILIPVTAFVEIKVKKTKSSVKSSTKIKEVIKN